MGEALLPAKLGACPEPTCLSRLLSTHVLTSSLDSPRRWVTHGTWGVTRAEAAHGSLPLECSEGWGRATSREGRSDGPGFPQDGEGDAEGHARLCPCPASCSTISSVPPPRPWEWLSLGWPLNTA